MKTFHPSGPSLRLLFFPAFLFTFSLACAQVPPAPAPPTVPDRPGLHPVTPATTGPTGARRQGPPVIPPNPWFGEKPVPSDSELKVLQDARDAAEKKVEVLHANRTYVERFGAADDLVRTLMFNNPAINDPIFGEADLFRFKYSQVLHETTWNIGLENSRDILLPDPLGDWLTIHMSSGTIGPRRPLEEVLLHTPPERAQAVRAFYGLEAVHQAALDDKDAKVALQKVRDAFQALDAAVREAMSKDAAVKTLIEKYPYLLYGRRDLGIGVAKTMIMS